MESEQNSNTFENLGREAFSIGIPRTPAKDKDLWIALRECGAFTDVNVSLVDSLDAWLRGWDEENIAAPVEGRTDEENVAIWAARPSNKKTVAHVLGIKEDISEKRFQAALQGALTRKSLTADLVREWRTAR
jgi:hypothetical protein